MVDVSIVIPTRDRPALLATAIRCGVGQRGGSVEVIVVDDGSERPVELDLPTAVAGRVTVVRHSRSRGVSAARNTGVAHAAGEWIAFLDDDDVWAPTKLARQLAAADEAGRPWAYAGYVDVDGDLELLGGAPPPAPDEVVRDLASHNSVPGSASNVVVRATALARAGGFDPDLHVHEDWDLWIRLARAGPPGYVPEPLVALRRHRGNASAQLAPMLRDLPQIADRHGISVDYARHLRWAAWTAMAAGRRGTAAGWYLSAATHGDLLSLGRAAVALTRPRVALNRADQPVGSWAMAAEQWLRELR
jgi:glycosyltransferase involved in cell wall biosynthesis